MHRGIYRYWTVGLILGMILMLPVGGAQAQEEKVELKQNQGPEEQHLILHVIRSGGEGPGKTLRSLDLSFAAHPASRSTLHFGTKVPIKTTTFNFTQVDSSGVPVPVHSYTYQNLGFEVSANPYPDLTAGGQIVLNFKYELSYLSEMESPGYGDGSPTIRTNEANRVLALAPGEKVMVAEFHQAREVAMLAECLGLEPAASELAGAPWQLSLELLSD